MPILDDPKNEAFCQYRAQNKSADEAFVLAGYSRNRSNAARMNAKEHIKARIAELLEKKANAAQSTHVWDAVILFGRMVDLIKKAEDVGDIKTAIDGQKFVLKAFGYEDSPTLTHEHLKGQKLSASQAEDSEKGELKKAGAEMTKALDAVLKAQRKRSQT